MEINLEKQVLMFPLHPLFALLLVASRDAEALSSYDAMEEMQIEKR